MTPVTALKTVLKKIPLFASLSETDLQDLAILLRWKGIEKGEILFRQGDEGTALYIIMQGRIKISLSRRMEKVTLAILGQGEFLGEMALLDDQPRSADAVALENSHLYALNRKDFLSFLFNKDIAVRAILRSLSIRLRKTDDLLAEMCFLSLSARLAKRLVELVESQGPNEKNCRECTLKISQQELGDILGVSRESINKELKTLRDKGILATARNFIEVYDLESLKKRMP